MRRRDHVTRPPGELRRALASVIELVVFLTFLVALLATTLIADAILNGGPK